MNRNIAYQTDQLVRYFSHNRITWAQFYESERVVIDELELGAQQSVLDIGCGCGGLGLTLRERYGVRHYTGVDINSLVTDAAAKLNSEAEILCGDILQLDRAALRGRMFDTVFSLSCVDWNVEFVEMLAAAWSHVRAGGHLVATFRVTDQEGCADMAHSYQYINFAGERVGELAAYVVVNARELLRKLLAFGPASISAYGYWGKPSTTAVTPYERLCFGAFALRRAAIDGSERPRLNLRLPAEIRDAAELA